MAESENRANAASDGGKARAEKLTAEQRRDIAKKAAQARWEKQSKPPSGQASHQGQNGHFSMPSAPNRVNLPQGSNDDIESAVQGAAVPKAIFWGELNLVGVKLPCYVLEDGQRIIGRAAANKLLTGTQSGKFEQTISVRSLQPFIDAESIIDRFITFNAEGLEGLGVTLKGLPADVLIDICQGFVRALEATYSNRPIPGAPGLTQRQAEIAVQASVFLGAIAKVGLDALIDEATGYQEYREKNALEVKLRAYLAGEMRKWEKTFPDALWEEFGRLTNWKGSIQKRPKYWGKLVMELIYEYLDPDVAQWLKENAPKPKGRQNYHQWLSSQYGLQKLIQHIWQVVGMAKTCQTMPELKQRMAETFGDTPVQLTLTIPRDEKGKK